MGFKKKKIYAIVGSNGCGKTTFFNKLFQTYYDQHIFYVKQNDLLIEELNVYENLKFCHYDFTNEDINTFIELERIKALYPSQISLGQRQMIVILCALSSHKQLILLDETFSALQEKRLKTLMNLCVDYVHQHDCIMLIITHQKEVIAYCDDVIHFDEIDDRDHFDLKDKEKDKLSINQVLKLQERYWIRHLIYLVIIAMCFVFIGTIWYQREYIYEAQEKQIKEHLSSEVFIMNNTDIYHDFAGYETYYSSLSHETMTTMKKTKGLSDFEPFLHLSIEPKRKNREVYYDPLIIHQGKQKRQISLPINAEYLIHPYTSYSRMDESIQCQTSHDHGLILTQSFASMLGFDEQHDYENTQIELHISIPISQTPNHDIEVSVGYEGQWEMRPIEARYITYKEITMTFDIKGILMNEDSSYPYVSKTYAIAFLDINTIKVLQSQYNIDYQPNAYFAKINDIKNVKQIKKDIEQISPTLTFQSVYDFFQLDDSLNDFLNTLTMISIVPLILSISLLLYTLIIQRKKRVTLYEKCLSYEYSMKLCDLLIIKRYLMDGLITIILYQCIHLINEYIINSFGLQKAGFQPFVLVILCLFICLIPIGVDMYVMHKKYHSRMEA